MTIDTHLKREMLSRHIRRMLWIRHKQAILLNSNISKGTVNRGYIQWTTLQTTFQRNAR